jgi:hypothetical protein
MVVEILEKEPEPVKESDTATVEDVEDTTKMDSPKVENEKVPEVKSSSPMLEAQTSAKSHRDEGAHARQRSPSVSTVDSSNRREPPRRRGPPVGYQMGPAGTGAIDRSHSQERDTSNHHSPMAAHGFDNRFDDRAYRGGGGRGGAYFGGRGRYGESVHTVSPLLFRLSWRVQASCFDCIFGFFITFVASNQCIKFLELEFSASQLTLDRIPSHSP